MGVGGQGVCSLGLLGRLKGVQWAVSSILPGISKTSLASRKATRVVGPSIWIPEKRVQSVVIQRVLKRVSWVVSYHIGSVWPLVKLKTFYKVLVQDMEPGWGAVWVDGLAYKGLLDGGQYLPWCPQTTLASGKASGAVCSSVEPRVGAQSRVAGQTLRNVGVFPLGHANYLTFILF